MSKSPTGRRLVLQALAGGVGTGLAIPGLGTADESHRHVAEQARLEAAAEAAAAAGPLPGFFSPAQKETLASLAEAIVPGSAKADVAGFLDRLLAVDSAAGQRAFLAALGAIEGVAIARHGRAWRSLDAAQQTELLTAISTGPSSGATRYPVPAAVPPGPAPTLRDRFDHLKARIATAYFTSEPGLRELGWKGEPIHEAFTGCPHPAGH